MTTAEIRDQVCYAYSFYEKGWKSLPSGTVEEIVRDFDALSSKVRPLSADDVGIVTLLKPKTAALLADRVWLQFPGDDDRLDFAFGWESPMAIRLGALLALIRAGGDFDRASGSHESLTGPGSEFVAFTEGELARDYRLRRRARVSPLYASPGERDADYRPGNVALVVSVVENVAVVQEESLTWEQVLEFRQDAEARSAYRRFVHWLDKEMVGKPADFICDEVSARLTSYSWALRKHGLQAVVGAIGRTLEAKSLMGASATSAAIQSLTNQPLIAALAGAGLLIGQAAIHVSAALIEREDLLVGNGDISFVHDIHSRVRGAR